MTCIHYRPWHTIAKSPDLEPLNTEQCFLWLEDEEKCERNEPCPKPWVKPCESSSPVNSPE